MVKNVQVASPSPIREILQSDTPDLHIQIPFYQRAYDWGKKHWGDLYDDIISRQEKVRIDPEDQHYFGDVYLEGPQPTARKMSLVDGQQRLTSVYLIFICARDYFFQRKEWTVGVKELVFVGDEIVKDRDGNYKRSRSGQKLFNQLNEEAQLYNQIDLTEEEWKEIVTMDPPVVPVKGDNNVNKTKKVERTCSSAIIDAFASENWVKPVTGQAVKYELGKPDDFPPVARMLETLEKRLYRTDRTTQEPDPNSPTISLGRLNETFFKTHVLPAMAPSRKILLMRQAPPPNDTCEKLLEAYKYFSDRFLEFEKTITKDTKMSGYKKINDFVGTLLEHFCLTRISVPDDITANEMFENINNRGTRKLKDQDLAKSKIFRVIDEELSHPTLNQDKNDLMEKYDADWTEIRNLITSGDEANYSMDEFLYCYFVNFVDDTTKTSTLLDVVQDHIQMPSRSAPSSKARELIPSLKKWAKHFVALRNPNQGDVFGPRTSHQDLKFFLTKLRNLDPKFPYVPIIQAFEKYWSQGRKDEFENIVRIITRFHVRNKSIGPARGAQMESVFRECMKNIKSDKTLNEIIDNLTRDKKIHLSDAQLSDNLENFSWSTSQDVLYYVLQEVEDTLSGSSGPQPDVTNEHIMAKSLNTKWKDYIKTENNLTTDEEAEEFHKEWRHKIGNLTLLSDSANKSGSDKLFSDKISIYRQDGYQLTKSVGNKTKWTETELQQRNDELKQKIVSLLDITTLRH